MEGAGTMTAIFTGITEVFTFVIGKIPEVINLIVTEPLLLMGVGLMITGAVVSFARRMISLS